MKILNILLISQCICHLRRQESSQDISLLDPKDSARMLCHLCTLLGLLRVKKSLMELVFTREWKRLRMQAGKTVDSQH